MSQAQYRILKQFNNKFLLFVKHMINYAPNIKEIRILPTALEYVINHGDPTQVAILFYDNMSIYSDRIYKDKPDRELLDDAFLLNQFSHALNRNKNKLKDDKYELFSNVLDNEKNEIKYHIINARDKWDKTNQETQLKLWKDLQILLKLSEKYVKLTRGN